MIAFLIRSTRLGALVGVLAVLAAPALARQEPAPPAEQPAAEPDVPEETPPEPPAVEPDPADTVARPRFWSRFSAVLGGTFATAASDFQAARRFTEFAEEGTLDTDYARSAGPGFEVGLEYRVGRHLGVAASWNRVGRDASAAFDTAIPHPLYLRQPRRATGAVDGLSYAERAFHFDLVYRHEHGRLRYGMFAGPSHVHVSSDLIERVQYQQAYPFDAVQVTSVPRRTSGAGAFGLNLGAEAEYRWRPRFGTLLVVRYHRANVEVPQPEDDAAEVTAGGLQIGAALRLQF